MHDGTVGIGPASASLRRVRAADNRTLRGQRSAWLADADRRLQVIVEEHHAPLGQLAVERMASGSTLAAPHWRREAGPGRAVSCSTCWPSSTPHGCARYVVTAVRRDGTLRGPNLDLLREVCAATDRPVIASGGVSSLDDLAPSPAWSPTASRAPPSARRCTSARSRCPKRSPPLEEARSGPAQLRWLRSDPVTTEVSHGVTVRSKASGQRAEAASMTVAPRSANW